MEAITTWGSLDTLYEHIGEVVPEKLEPLLAEHSETVLESRELMRLVRDVDVVLDAERTRWDYDREAVVHFREYEGSAATIDRLPPLTGERPDGAMRELREAGFPAAQGRGGGRGAAPGGGHGTAGAGRPDDGSLQLSMDFDVVSGGGSAPAYAVAATSAVKGAEALAQASGDVPGALAAAIEAAVGPADISTWLREQDAVGIALVVDDPRPLAGTPLAMAVAGADGRCVAAEGPVRPSRCGISWSGWEPMVRPRRQAAAHRALRRGSGRDAAAGGVRHPGRGLSRERCLRAQKIADVVAERVDLGPAAGRGPDSGRLRRPRGPVGPRRPSIARAVAP